MAGQIPPHAQDEGWSTVSVVAAGVGIAVLVLATLFVANELMPTDGKLFYTSRSAACNCSDTGNAASLGSGTLEFAELPADKNSAECVFGAQDWRYTVVGVAKSKTIQWNDGRAGVDAKGTWLVAHIKLENLSDVTSSYSPDELIVQDGAGKVYRADPSLSYAYSRSRNMADPFSSFPPDVSSEIGVLFDVNPDAGNLKLLSIRCSRATIGLPK